MCWGVSALEDRGYQLHVERVLSEAAAVGEGAITAGPPGFLPDRSDQAKSLLRRNRLQVIAGQVHAVLHDTDIKGPELAHIDGHAHWLSAIGAEILVLSAIPERNGPRSQRSTLTNSQWAHLLHLVGDPLDVLELASGRIRHVQLNDVDPDLAHQVRNGSITYEEAVALNLYQPLGEGAAHVAGVLEALKGMRYRGWYTLEEETRLASHDDRPLGRISRSLGFLLPLLS